MNTQNQRFNGHDLVIDEQEIDDVVYVAIEDMTLGERYAFAVTGSSVVQQTPDPSMTREMKPAQAYMLERTGAADIQH